MFASDCYKRRLKPCLTCKCCACCNKADRGNYNPRKMEERHGFEKMQKMMTVVKPPPPERLI